MESVGAEPHVQPRDTWAAQTCAFRGAIHGFWKVPCGYFLSSWLYHLYFMFGPMAHVEGSIRSKHSGYVLAKLIAGA